MSSFSISRVAQYARYHYTTQFKQYLGVVLQLIGWPLLFGALSRDIETVSGIATAIYLFVAIGFAVRTTYAMRGRTTHILECTTPISNEERMLFMLFNGAVVFPLVVAVTAAIAMALTTPFVYAPVSLGYELWRLLSDVLFNWPIYILVQIIFSSSLLINIMARRNLLLAYVVAFVGVMTLFGIMGRVGLEIMIRNEEQVNAFFSNFSNFSIPEPIGITLYVLIPVCLYALGYVALRKRQVKW